MSLAERMMLIFNPNALIAFDDDIGEWVMFEDILVPDDRTGCDLTFRVEYRCNHLGEKARCWLVFNPVTPIFDRDYHRTHLSECGFICFGLGLSASESPYDLSFAILRVRLWAAGYLLHQRQGYEVVCQLIPGWGGQS